MQGKLYIKLCTCVGRIFLNILMYYWCLYLKNCCYCDKNRKWGPLCPGLPYALTAANGAIRCEAHNSCSFGQLTFASSIILGMEWCHG